MLRSRSACLLAPLPFAWLTGVNSVARLTASQVARPLRFALKPPCGFPFVHSFASMALCPIAHAPPLPKRSLIDKSNGYVFAGLAKTGAPSPELQYSAGVAPDSEDLWERMQERYMRDRTLEDLGEREVGGEGPSSSQQQQQEHKGQQQQPQQPGQQQLGRGSRPQQQQHSPAPGSSRGGGC